MCAKVCAADHLKKPRANAHREKPYACSRPGCMRKFAFSYGLKYHELVHSEEKPYICRHPGCGRSFTTKSILINHELRHTDEKPYVCDQLGCKRKFVWKTGLVNHQRKHTGEKPYTCSRPGESLRTKTTKKTSEKELLGCKALPEEPKSKIQWEMGRGLKRESSFEEPERKFRGKGG